ncbi:hypothetical protein F5Y16DRAFT_425257 [Xylariaceae sp. FL0255]|nr:hypothetical protein F5Y16DRAFT_425257 [Xylariaceae sp. FL0255]
MFAFQPLLLASLLAYGVLSQTPAEIIVNSSTPAADSTLIQIGFDDSLNYEFVASNPGAVDDIADYLPLAIANDLGTSASASDIFVAYLVPLQKSGYNATLARTYVPSSGVSKLETDIKVPSSGLYTDSDPDVAELASLIDPSISITGF